MAKGSLKLIIGPMFSGKSTEIIRNIKDCQEGRKQILVVNPVINNRYGMKCITTHNKLYYSNCINIGNLYQIYLNTEYKELYNNSETVIIDEYQFFNNSFDIIMKMVEIDGKDVIIASLDGDFKRKEFGDVLKLIPYADNVIKLTALCNKCNNGTKAPFTKRTISNNEKTLVGTDDIYEPVCRYHYLN